MNPKSQFITMLFVIVIAVGGYTGVRYMSALVHYGCQVEAEDCPPPFRLLAEMGWFLTGGGYVPFWTKD